MQAFALSREREVLTREVSALRAQVTELWELRNSVQEEGNAERFRMQAFALSKERDVLTQRLAELSLQTPGTLKAQFVRSGKYRLRRAGAAVKPMLPAPVFALAVRVARKMNL